MKKKILLTLSFLALCILLFCAVSVSAKTYGVLEYSIKSNKITITGYNEYASEITIPDKIEEYPVTAIKEKAFSYCDSLTSITIPDSVTSIGDGAFHGCDSLSKVNITDIGAWCNIYFHDNESNPLYYAKELYLNGELVTDLDIPDGVTAIKNYVFSGYTGLTSITIPDSVTSIGYKAFSGCTALTTITIPNSVTSIGDSAFSGCSGLTSVTISENLASIGFSVFDGCSALTNITIPDKVTTIEEAAFNGCSGLRSITLPDNLTSIKESAFRGCSGLLRIAIPDGVNSIGNSTFDGCTNLSDISIPGSVTSIGNSAFNGCKALKSITIPNSVISIGESAFRGCSKLANITVLCSDTSIGDNAFYMCNNLKGVNITDIGAWCKISFSNIDSNPLSLAKNLYLNGELVTELVIPGGITEIKDYAFYNCDNLTKVSIGSDTTLISDYAFYSCSNLKYVFFPAESLQIMNYTFGECPNIEIVFFAGSKNQWESVLKYIGNEALTDATIVYNAAKKTYKFVTNCNAILPDITDYAIFTAPTVKSENATFMGWYDNAAFNGSPVSFPYYGSATTLYASMIDRMGTSFDDVLDMKSNQEYTITTVEDGQLVYFKFTPRRTKEYRIHTAGSGDTYVSLYNSNRTLIESNDNDHDSCITRTLQADESYYIVVKLNAGTGKFTLITEEPVDYKINSITVKDSAGKEVADIPSGTFSATVSITNVSSSADMVIVLAQYTASGAFRGWKHGSVTGLSIGATFKFSTSIDNKQGDIAKLKAFCWDSSNLMTPLGGEATFGEV